jgi:hypothetical protein
MYHQAEDELGQGEHLLIESMKRLSESLLGSPPDNSEMNIPTERSYSDALTPNYRYRKSIAADKIGEIRGKQRVRRQFRCGWNSRGKPTIATKSGADARRRHIIPLSSISLPVSVHRLLALELPENSGMISRSGINKLNWLPTANFMRNYERPLGTVAETRAIWLIRSVYW